MIFLLTHLTLSKLITNRVVLTPQQPWKYLTKFAVDIGRGQWKLRARLSSSDKPDSQSSLQTVFSVYLEDKWDQTLSTTTCKQKHNLAKRNRDLQIPLNGQWSDQLQGTLSQKKRTHYWFFSISSCQISSKTKLTVQLQITNSDQSHFSSDQKSLNYLYPILLLIFLLALSGNLYRLIQKLNQTDNLQGTLLMFNIAIGSQFLGIIFQNIHLLVYSTNGKGLAVFEFFFQALDVISSLIVTSLFILIAYGWTLKSKQNPDPQLVIPICLFVGFAHVFVVGLGRITDDAYYKFSSYDGVPGIIVILIKIGLWAWFCWVLVQLYKSSRPSLHSFLVNFGVLASVYLLGFPFLILFSHVFVSYWRNTVITIGYQLLQIFCYFSFTLLFGEKSSYSKASTRSSSILPGQDHY